MQTTWNVSFTIGVLALGMTSSIVAAKDDETIVLEPTTPWSLDFAENKCRLARILGEGDDKHVIFFEQTMPSGGFSMTVAGPHFKRFRSDGTTVQYGENQPAQDDSPMLGEMGAYGTAIIYAATRMKSAGEVDASDVDPAEPAAIKDLPAIDVERAGLADRITFDRKQRTSVTMMLGNLAAPMEALNGCTQDLVKSWGVDIERHRKVRSFATWTNRADVGRRIAAVYPSRALRNGEQGYIRMRVLLDETGQATDCHIENLTLNESLDSPACDMLKHAEFTPAIDASGSADGVVLHSSNSIFDTGLS